MKKPSSITHLHLLSVVMTQLSEGELDRPVRLLDVGCGNGELMSYLQGGLPELRPGVSFEVYGLDVVDHGVQEAGYFDKTRQRLMEDHPQIDWEHRLVAIESDVAWPYADGFFDVVLSNQVLEHVADHERFFGEVARCLVEGGWSAHLFPVKECLYEGHLYLPLAHRFYNHDLRKAWIKMLSRLQLGKYPEHKKQSGVTLEQYSQRHSDYLLHYTNYPSTDELYQYTKKHGLRASFRYTQEFYFQKLRAVLGRPTRYAYSRSRSAFRDWLATLFFKRILSITLFVEKRESYRGE